MYEQCRYRSEVTALDALFQYLLKLGIRYPIGTLLNIVGPFLASYDCSVQ